MDRMRLKLYFLLIIGALVSYAVVLPGGRIRAGGDEKIEAKAQILKRLADYRSWKQVNKPGSNTPMDTFLISNSSAAG